MPNGGGGGAGQAPAFAVEGLAAATLGRSYRNMEPVIASLTGCGQVFIPCCT
ncbi:MAG TPA: hypothetical protein VMQ65_03420 [Candidatus Limnocylindria bacterium]|nr:hypothetical protein [Candidatus Limnocylindria bacterium]